MPAIVPAMSSNMKANQITTTCLLANSYRMMAGVGPCLHWKWCNMAVSIYLSYKALLRNELFCISLETSWLQTITKSLILAPV